MKRTFNEQQLDLFAKAWYHYSKNNLKAIKSLSPFPIGKCNARYYCHQLNSNTTIYFMESYDTIVAAIVPWGDHQLCVNFMHQAYHFDEFITGRTTTQHVHKFMKLFPLCTQYYRLPKGA